MDGSGSSNTNNGVLLFLGLNTYEKISKISTIQWKSIKNRKIERKRKTYCSRAIDGVKKGSV